MAIQPGDEIDAEDCRTELFGVDADKILRAKEEEYSKERAAAGVRSARRMHQNSGGPNQRRRHASMPSNIDNLSNLRRGRR